MDTANELERQLPHHPVSAVGAPVGAVESSTSAAADRAREAHRRKSVDQAAADAEQCVTAQRDTARCLVAAAAGQEVLLGDDDCRPLSAVGADESLPEAAVWGSGTVAAVGKRLSKRDSDWMFDQFDHDGSGSIDVVEMVATFKGRDVSTLNHAKIKAVWDPDGDRQVRWALHE